MGGSGPLARARQNITEIVGILFAVAMVAGLFGQPWLLLAGLAGMLFVTPLVALLFGDRDAIEEWWGAEKAEQVAANTDEDRESDPLEGLKLRYARGELSEAEFERHVQQLLDVDNLDSAAIDAGELGARTDGELEKRTDSHRDSTESDSDVEYA